MAVKTFNTRIKLKQDTNAHWVNPGGDPISQNNPGLILLDGELGFDTTNSNFKIGNGSSRWDLLKYIIGSAIIADYTSSPNGVILGNPIANTDTLNVALAKLQSQVSTAASSGVQSIGGATGTVTVGNGLTSTSEANGSVSTLVNGYIVNNAGLDSKALDINSTKIDGNYTTANTTNLATVATVTSALGTLTDTLTGTPGAGNTITAFDEVNGKVTATFASISITASQISNGSSTFQAKFTDGSHNVLTISDAPSGTTTYAKKLEFFDGTQTGGTLGTVNAASDTLYISKAVSDTNPIITKDDISGITGAMVYQGTLGTGGTITSLPSASLSNKGWVYVVSVAGTYDSKAAQIGDMFVSNGTSWDLIQGTVNVNNPGSTITAGDGSATTIATIEGTSITAKVSVTAGSATIASMTNDVVTLKSGVTQSGTSGTIGNNTESDIILAKAAKTGSAVDISTTAITDSSTSLIEASSVQNVLGTLAKYAVNTQHAGSLPLNGKEYFSTATNQTIKFHKVSKTGDYNDLNNKLIEGKNIEISNIANVNGYEFYDYIQNTGNTRIPFDSTINYYHNQKLTFEVEVSLKQSTSSSGQRLFGTDPTGTTSSLTGIRITTDNFIALLYRGSLIISSIGLPVTANHKYYINGEFDGIDTGSGNGTAYLYVKDLTTNEVVSFHQSYTINNTKFSTQINILGVSGAVEYAKTGTKLHYAKFWVNDNLIVYGIPAKKQSNQTLGLYNLQKKAFYPEYTSVAGHLTIEGAPERQENIISALVGDIYYTGSGNGIPASGHESMSENLTLHNIAKTGNTDDLIQGNTWILYCGSSTQIIDAES